MNVCMHGLSVAKLDGMVNKGTAIRPLGVFCLHAWGFGFLGLEGRGIFTALQETYVKRR